MFKQLIDKAEAIIFDFDGTIADTSKIWIDTDNIVCKELNIKLDMEHHLPLIQGNIFSHICEQMISHYNLNITADELINKYFDTYKKYAAQAILIPGASQFMQQLKNQGKKYGVGSANPTELNVKVLQDLGQQELIPEIFVSCEDVKIGKPHPEVFLEAARQLNVDITKCIVFEDSIVGCKAGKAAGATVICIGNKGKDIADFCIENFNQIINE